MADHSDPTSGENPFKGTPLEGLMGQFQQMMQPHEGPVNFTIAKDVARHASAAAGADPAPHAGQVGAIRDAVQLAEGWLDRATNVPAAATSANAWSRADWIDNTAETWQQLIEPIAAHIVGAMGEAMPDEAKSMAGPLLGVFTQIGGAVFAQQIGQALAGLAGEVLSSTDISIPVGPARVAAILPDNVTAFGEGLEHRAADVLLYVTLRECAHHRLFQHAPWLRSAVFGTVEEFGRGTKIDVAGIEEALSTIDPTNLEEAMAGGLFEPQRTPAQQAAVDKLETLLALIDGWVDDVVDQATRDTMPGAPALAEAMRRRRAAGGPAEQTFASLVGLELRPKKLREAATLSAAVRDRFGPDARDSVWSHPDLMPTASDLDDPLGFEPTSSDDAFDAALNELLDGDDSA